MKNIQKTYLSQILEIEKNVSKMSNGRMECNVDKPFSELDNWDVLNMHVGQLPYSELIQAPFKTEGEMKIALAFVRGVQLVVQTVYGKFR